VKPVFIFIPYLAINSCLSNTHYIPEHCMNKIEALNGADVLVGVTDKQVYNVISARREINQVRRHRARSGYHLR
jgi:hypothetical protein